MNPPVDAEPPPYHDWMSAVPDTLLLPPPPSITYHSSPTTNASTDEATRAHHWTDVNPLWPRRQLTEHEQQALTIGFASIIRPQELQGEVVPNRTKPGRWLVRSLTRCQDACLLSSVPLYSPIHGTVGNTTYFEVKIWKLSKDAAVAIGFIAPPYPTWRQPGWERASLAVHSDDGHKFVNDSYGGRDFAKPFKVGDTVGIGMRWRKASAKDSDLPSYSEETVEVFFTRNGEEEQKWDLHEANDSDMIQPGGVNGLEGDRDLHAAMGVFGGCEVEVLFGRHNWSFVDPESLSKQAHD